MSDDQQNNSLKSYDSLRPSYVRFLNRTERSVDIIWINYEGARIKYKTLEPLQFFDVNTYASHPWIFRDNETCDRMVVSSKDIYQPEPWVSADPSNPNNVRRSPTRKLVSITIPVYTLKERCFQVIRKALTVKHCIKLLDIPVSLQKEFMTFMDRVQR